MLIIHSFIQKQQGNTTDTDSSSSSIDERGHGDTYSEDSDTDDITGDPTETLLRQARKEAIQQAKADAKARRKSEKAQKAQRAREVEDRRGRVVKLSKLSSISGGGDRGSVEIECHACGQKGHKRNKCPNKAKLRRRADDRQPEELDY